MTMRGARARLLWTLVFAFFTILSLDYWWWDADVRVGAIGLPIWIFYFVGLQFALAVAVFFFWRHYWRDRSDDGGGELEESSP